MKELYHICLTAHSEVLLRNLDDVRTMTNLSALAAWRNDVQIMSDSDMSTHIHENVFCEDPGHFVWSQILSLTKAFNHRHGRKGRLFDPKPFIMKLQGSRHIQMSLSYSLRQGLHHGVSDTAFSYPYSTCNFVFAEERGASVGSPAYTSRNDIRTLICKNADFPDTWQADKNGILLRNTFEELPLLETWFGTPKSFIYSMTRKTSKEWLDEQLLDNSDCPLVTLDLLEKGYTADDVSQMLANENNQKYRARTMTDMEVCILIDENMLGKFNASSVYELSPGQKQKIFNELFFDIGIKSEKQLSRCLAMDYQR